MIRTDELARRIGALRRQKGLTQSALAERLEVSIQAVSKWETGRALPELSRIDELADILGVEVAYLLQGDRLKANCSEKKHIITERNGL